MDEEDLESACGMKTRDFWVLAQEFKKFHIPKTKKFKLNVPAFTLLYRIKMRENPG